MQKGRVNVVGSANMDLVVRTVRFPLPGETILGAEFSTFPGGKGANQAVAIGKLGGNPLFVGKLGQDSFALDLQ
ncbi:MAG TPA: PfkB family carbohydrate kinase, partial [Fimbriimonas sp.]|nr:PfkB family carbohydrate kinase [Fimbriimonas sp.]